MKVIGVRFKTGGRIYYFDPLDYALAEGDGVIVETARGQEYGEVAQTVTEVEETAIVSPLKPIIRPATDQDGAMRRQNSAKEGEAFQICQKKIESHGLDMHLVSAEYSFDGSKLVFFFTADERVDFRELVKDLASQFRTRIELRQIGVRDEAKMLGGLGSCGRPVCCKTFLADFRPVSIKMAKEQNLSLSPTKISGLCGRLMCCLQYEQSAYEEMRKKMPRVNRDILTPDGIGVVVENNVITERTKVRIALPDGTIDLREYHYSAVGNPGEPLPVPLKAETAAKEKAGDASAPEASVPTAQGDDAAVPGKSTLKRRRRGGRGRGQGQPRERADAPSDGAEAQQPAKAAKPSPRQSQPNREAHCETADREQNSQSAQGAAAQGAPHKRRRRGGANRKKPQQTASAPTPSEE